MASREEKDNNNKCMAGTIYGELVEECGRNMKIVYSRDVDVLTIQLSGGQPSDSTDMAGGLSCTYPKMDDL